MIPIFVLTLRALGRGRRLLLVAVLLAVPVLLAVAYRASAPYQHDFRPAYHTFDRFILPFLIQLFDQLIVPILLPLTALIFATSALGGEVEDRTLLYLTLRPVSRLVIVVAKALAAMLVTTVLVEISLAVMYAIGVQGYASAGAGQSFGANMLAGLAGCLAYCSLFLLVGLLAPRRALLVGFLYVLVWEGVAAGFSTGLATLSVRRYVEGVLHASLGPVSFPHLVWPSISGTTSALVVAAIVAGGIALSTVRLHRMELP